ncbi:MAG: extracellular solute-binding protein, partial [Acidobacteriota bacterium]
MRSKKIGSIVVFHLIVLVLGVSQAKAQTDSELDAMIEGAKKEGEVVFYGSISISEAVPVLKAFEKKYPFLKVKHYRAGSDTLMEKILVETRAGRHAADVYNLRAFTATILVQKGLFAKHPTRHGKFYREGFKDPGERWTSFYMNPATFGFNTELVSPAEAPKNWADLLHPRWKGQMIMDREESEWYANMLKVMGAEKGREFMKKLAAQEIVFRRGHTLQAQLVAAGEFKIGVVLYTPRMEKMKKQGAPIDWGRADPVIAYHYSLGVAAQAPHPKAARLFVDFFLSKEGQELLVGVGRIPVRSGVKPKPAYLVDGVKLVPSDAALAKKDFKKYYDEYREVFNVP